MKSRVLYRHDVILQVFEVAYALAVSRAKELGEVENDTLWDQTLKLGVINYGAHVRAIWLEA